MAGRIVRVSGPLVVAEGLVNPIMYGVVKVGKLRLFGEIISLGANTVSIQVYEQTEGVGPGEPVEASGDQLSVELGPGLMSQIYDGIQRPLDVIAAAHGSFIARGIEEPAIDYKRAWEFTAVAHSGSEVVGGTRLGFVQETEIVKHWGMVPPGLRGTITSLSSGTYTVTERIGELEDPFGQKHELKLSHRWPVRQGRPYRRKLNPGVPLVTGQRCSTPSFHWPRAAPAAYRVRSGRARRWCSSSSPSGRTPTSSSTSAAASAATR